MTSLYANRTGLIGTPIRVKSGSHGFTYELTFVDPGHAEVKHSFSGAPITFTDERELVIGVQMNTQTKTMRTLWLRETKPWVVGVSRQGQLI